MNKNLISMILISVFFFGYFFNGLFLYLETGNPNNTNDFNFHYEKANGLTEKNYSIGYYWFFSLFAFNQFIFYLANILMPVVIIPLLLWLLVKNNWITAIYFLGLKFGNQIIFSGTFPMALIICFFLIYLLFRKNWLLLLILTFLAANSHSYGLELFILIWIAELSTLIIKHTKNLITLTWIISIPNMVFAESIERSHNIIKLNDLIKVFLFSTPLPIIFFGLKQLIKEKDLFYWILFVVPFFIMFFVPSRVLSISAIIISIYAAKQLPKENKIIKIGFILILLLTFFYFIIEKISCGGFHWLNANDYLTCF